MDSIEGVEDLEPRLPVAYSQGFVYVSIIHGPGPKATTVIGTDTGPTINEVSHE